MVNPQPTGAQGAIWRAMRLSGVALDTTGASEVVKVLTWLVRQQPLVLQRFLPDQNDRHTAEGFGPNSYWRCKLDKFTGRIELLTLESPAGRQALAEFTATLVGLMASVWRIYGPLLGNQPPHSLFPAKIEGETVATTTELMRQAAAVRADALEQLRIHATSINLLATQLEATGRYDSRAIRTGLYQLLAEGKVTHQRGNLLTLAS